MTPELGWWMARDDQRNSAEQRSAELQARSNDSLSERAGTKEQGGAAPVSPAEVEKLRRLVVELERQNKRLRKRCEDAELEIVSLEKKLKDTENTLSFRLGYALIHSTKSMQTLRALPSVLLELRRDSRRRRPPSLANATLTVLRAQARRLTKRQRQE